MFRAGCVVQPATSKSKELASMIGSGCDAQPFRNVRAATVRRANTSLITQRPGCPMICMAADSECWCSSHSHPLIKRHQRRRGRSAVVAARVDARAGRAAVGVTNRDRPPPPPRPSRRGLAVAVPPRAACPRARRAPRAACRRWLAPPPPLSRNAGVSCRSRRSPSARRRARRRIGLVGYPIWPLLEQPADDKLVIHHDPPETCCSMNRHT